MKRLYRFILKTFLPMFAMTFFIVLFIVLMQFLWRYMDDLVGKGLGFGVLSELFFYAAVSMVPMALPLAILLASLMTFGNLGERSELTAIKASGVSLLKTMSPLIVLIGAIAVGAFFFQNDVLPRAQVKMWTLLFSARQKSPELEIPEGTFYDQIPGYNLYVRQKNHDTGMLYNVMIYDVSHGDNGTILLADSARLAFTPDMKYLYLHLWQGEQFENLREQKTNIDNVPFRRERFDDKELLIQFDANFNRIDEQGMANQYIGKNIHQLNVAIDSLQNRIDSIGNRTKYDFDQVSFPTLFGKKLNGGGHKHPEPAKTKADISRPVLLDTLLLAMSQSERDMIFASAKSDVDMRDTELEFRAMQVNDEKNRVRRHRIELIKKYTLSVACIVFLFIGAPLGAIIRKGGLGAPLVISVLLFLVYYIIDNTGFKMAKEGIVQAWAGMWLSTFILLPLGIFVTYKAMNDSSVFNPDLYREFFRRLLGLPEKRHVVKKEVIINDISRQEILPQLEMLEHRAQAWLRSYGKKLSYRQYWTRGCRRRPLERIGHETDAVVTYLSDSRDLKVIDMLNRYPVVNWVWIYEPVRSARIRRILMWFVPAGALFYLLAQPYTRRLREQIRNVADVTRRLMDYTPEAVGQD